MPVHDRGRLAHFEMGSKPSAPNSSHWLDARSTSIARTLLDARFGPPTAPQKAIAKGSASVYSLKIALVTPP